MRIICFCMIFVQYNDTLLLQADVNSYMKFPVSHYISVQKYWQKPK